MQSDVFFNDGFYAALARALDPARGVAVFIAENALLDARPLGRVVDGLERTRGFAGARAFGAEVGVSDGGRLAMVVATRDAELAARPDGLARARVDPHAAVVAAAADAAHESATNWLGPTIAAAAAEPFAFYSAQTHAAAFLLPNAWARALPCGHPQRVRGRGGGVCAAGGAS